MRPPYLLLLGAMLTATAACGERAADPAVVRDSAGVRVVENRTRTEGGPDLRLGAPTLDLGGADAPPEQAFNAVAVAALLPDGRLVVAEEDGTVRHFGSDGTLLATAGGQGDGPGEFRLVAGGGLRGDSLWLYDYFHRRITVLDRRGSLVGVRPLEGEDPAVLPVGTLGDGFLLARTSRPTGIERLGLRRDTVPYLWFDGEGRRRTVIAELPGREYVVGEEDGRLTMASPPFVRGARHAARGDRWVHGDQERREVRALDRDGTLRMIVRWPGPDLRVTDAALAAEIEDRVARHSGDDPQGLRRFLSELPHPDTRPAHGRLHVGPDGEIWVETVPPESGWHVFEPDGTWRTTVPAPGRFRITQILPDRVVGVWQDELDVEHVQVRPIEGD